MITFEIDCMPQNVKKKSITFFIWCTNKINFGIFSDSLEDGFQCPENEQLGQNGAKIPHPTYPHPEDCQKFYICRNGIMPQKGSCSPGSVYNDETFKCDEPENVPGW